LRFAPLPAAVIADALAGRFGWTIEEAQAAAALADGRLGRALGRDEDGRSGARDVAAGVLERVASSRGPLDRLADAQALIARADVPKGKGEGRTKTAAASRQDISVRLDAMAGLLRDIGVLTTRADHRCLANSDLTGQLAELMPAFRGDRLVRAFTVVGQARAALERNASQKVVADWLALNL
jgi:hypothetical protein